jgi:hypothetical protein
MARRRKKDPPDRFLEAVPQLGALLFMAIMFVPGFKQMLGGIAVLTMWLAGATVLIGLGIILWRRNWRSNEIDFLVGPIPTPRAIPLAAIRPFPRADRIEPIEPTETRWSLELLRSLDWKHYEDVVAAFTKHLGLLGKTTRIGADGGIDVHVYEPGNPRPVMVVQCKAWESYRVGVKPIRELYGVMAAEQVKEGAFFTTGEFTQEALQFAQGKQLDLVNGQEFLTRIGRRRPQALTVDRN